MKSPLKLGFLLSVCALAGACTSEETLGEKASVVKNDAVRTSKSAVHKVEEVLCAKSDAICLAEQAKNRAGEAVDAVVDTAKEIEGKVDGK